MKIILFKFKFSNELNKRIEGCFSWTDASFSRSTPCWLCFICDLNGTQMGGCQPTDFNQRTWIIFSVQNDEENKTWGKKVWIKRHNNKHLNLSYTPHLSLKKNIQNKLFILMCICLVSFQYLNNTDLMDWYLEKGYCIHTLIPLLTKLTLCRS